MEPSRRAAFLRRRRCWRPADERGDEPRRPESGESGAPQGPASPIETGIYIIPMELTEQYYLTQIANEGIWNLDPPILVHRPETQMFRADDAWFRHILSQMREVRKPGAHRCVFPPEGDRHHALDIDISLIDVQVYFDDYTKLRANRPETDEDYKHYNLNLRWVDRLCGKQLHTQMVMAAAVHHYRPNGLFALHFHNLIFGIRKQVEPDEHIGVINLLPVVKALGDGRTINIIAEL